MIRSLLGHASWSQRSRISELGFEWAAIGIARRRSLRVSAALTSEKYGVSAISGCLTLMTRHDGRETQYQIGPD